MKTLSILKTFCNTVIDRHATLQRMTMRNMERGIDERVCKTVECHDGSRVRSARSGRVAIENRKGVQNVCLPEEYKTSEDLARAILFPCT